MARINKQVRLTTLLLVLAICAAPLAYLAWLHESARRAGRAVVFVRQNAGEVAIPTSQQSPFEQMLWGDWSYHSATRLRLSGAEVSDAEIAKVIRELPHLESLTLDRSQVGDQALEAIARLTKLKTLALDSTPISDADIDRIATCEGLDELSLSRCKVSDQGIAKLGNCRKLKMLFLDGAPVTGEFLAALGDCRELTELSLGESKVTDRGLEQIGAISRLKRLRLNKTQVTNACLKSLVTASLLEDLDLSGTQVTDVTLLNELTELRSLSITNTNVSRIQIDNLKYLRILNASRTKLGDAELPALGVSPSLRWLNLSGTPTSKASIFDLKLKLKMCLVIE